MSTGKRVGPTLVNFCQNLADFNWNVVSQTSEGRCKSNCIILAPREVCIETIFATWFIVAVLICCHIAYMQNLYINCSGPAHYDVSIRQAARAAFVTSSFKIFLTQNFPRCRSHVLYIAFEGDDSAIQWCQFCLSLSGSLFNILQLFASFSQNPKLLQWWTVLTTLAICRVMF